MIRIKKHYVKEKADLDDCLERMYDKIKEIMNLSMNKDTKVKNIPDGIILAKMKGGYTNV